MLAQALGAFDLAPDHDLGIMQHGQTLPDMTRRVLEGLDPAGPLKPDFVLAQGDTTTTFVAALAAFYRRIRFGHIEAGLRTRALRNRFPEEFNRRGVALVAAQHYAPTPWAADNLLKENHPAETIFVTGNTGIDAVRHVAAQTTKTWYADWRGRSSCSQPTVARTSASLSETSPALPWK